MPVKDAYNSMIVWIRCLLDEEMCNVDNADQIGHYCLLAAAIFEKEIMNTDQWAQSWGYMVRDGYVFEMLGEERKMALVGLMSEMLEKYHMKFAMLVWALGKSFSRDPLGIYYRGLYDSLEIGNEVYAWQCLTVIDSILEEDERKNVALEIRRRIVESGGCLSDRIRELLDLMV